VRVALTQMRCGEDSEANLSRQLSLVEQAATAGAKIICTQELFRSQYFCQVEDHRFFQHACARDCRLAVRAPRRRLNA
jgi:N-carbamoylputrescine amidase